MLKSSVPGRRFRPYSSWWDGQGAARVLAYSVLGTDGACAPAASPGDGQARGDDGQGLRVCSAEAIERIRYTAVVAGTDPAGRGPTRCMPPSAAWRALRRLPQAPTLATCWSQLSQTYARWRYPPQRVLDFGERGWQVIDWQALRRARLRLRQPVPLSTTRDLERQPFERQLEIVVAASGLQRRRLLLDRLGPGLSAWFDEDSSHEETDAELAITRLATLLAYLREG